MFETVDGRIEELPEVSDVEGWKFNNVWTVGKNTDVKFNIDNNIEGKSPCSWHQPLYT